MTFSIRAACFLRALLACLLTFVACILDQHAAQAAPATARTVVTESWRLIRQSGSQKKYGCFVQRDLGRANVFGRVVRKRGTTYVQLLTNAALKKLRRSTPSRYRTLKRARKSCVAATAIEPCSVTQPCTAKKLVLEEAVSNSVNLTVGQTVSFKVAAIDRAGFRTQRGLPLPVVLAHRVNGESVGVVEGTLSNDSLEMTTNTLALLGEHEFVAASDGIDESDPITVTVQVGAPERIEVVSVPESVDIQVPFAMTLRVVDAYGNVVTAAQEELVLEVPEGKVVTGTTESTVLENGSSLFSAIRVKSEGPLAITARVPTFSLTQQISVPVNSRRMTALTWSTHETAGLSNLQPMHMIRDWGVFEGNDPLWLEHHLDQVVEDALQAMNAAREGNRALLFLWDMFPLPDDERDAVRDANGVVQGFTPSSGTFRPFQSIWWNESAPRSRQKTTMLLEALKNRGVPIDYIIADTEQWLNHWETDVKASQLYGANLTDAGDANTKEARRMAVYNALNADPRMDLPDDPQFGFTDTRPLRQQVTLGDLIPDVTHWWMPDTANDLTRRLAYLQYDTLMVQRSATYKNWAVLEPALASYPNIKLSDYGYIHYDPSVPVPSTNGHEEYRFGGPQQKIVGNVQSHPMYGAIPDLVYLYRFSGPGNWIRQEASPFAALRHNLNIRIGAYLSRPNAPFQPWIAPYSVDSENIRIGRTDFYKELMYHLALLADEKFLFWNADVVASRSDTEMFSSLLAEVDRAVGYSVRRVPKMTSIIPWRQPYIVSVQENDRGRVSRLSVDLPDGVSIDDTIISSSPPTFELPGGITLTFEGQQIERDPYSTKGVWLIGNE